jgi:hypothetical protein
MPTTDGDGSGTLGCASSPSRTHGHNVIDNSRAASLASTLYGKGVSLDLGPLLDPLAVWRDSVVSSSVTMLGMSPMLASNRRQQLGHAVELSPVGIGLPHFSAAQVRVCVVIRTSAPR